MKDFVSCIGWKVLRVEIASKVFLSQGYVWRLVRSAKDKVHAYAERSDYD